MMTKGKTSRRDFLKLAAGTAAFGPFFSFPGRALAGQKTLKIAKWAHFLPEFDQWFQNGRPKNWARKTIPRSRLISFLLRKFAPAPSLRPRPAKDMISSCFPGLQRNSGST